jgi:hypothetical protein
MKLRSSSLAALAMLLSVPGSALADVGQAPLLLFVRRY